MRADRHTHILCTKTDLKVLKHTHAHSCKYAYTSTYLYTSVHTPAYTRIWSLPYTPVRRAFISGFELMNKWIYIDSAWQLNCALHCRLPVLAIYTYLSLILISLLLSIFLSHSLSLSLVLISSLALSLLCCCKLLQSQQFVEIGLEDCELQREKGIENEGEGERGEEREERKRGRMEKSRRERACLQSAS